MNRTPFAVAAVALVLASAPGAHGRLAEPSAMAPGTGGQLPVTSRPAAVTGAPLLHLRLNEGSASAGGTLWRVDNSGSAVVRADVVTDGGGRAVRVAGRKGGWAARLPRSASTTDSPRAVIRVRGTDAGDPLDPGARDFAFGAVWKLDAVSEGSRADNGDNLVQRGLSGDRAQFKLQVDNRLPMCTVRGDSGVVVASASRISAGQWYRARCYRDGVNVTIRVWKLRSDGVVAVASATERGAIGALSFAARVPLSVGGKLDGSGDPLPGSGDQFNGVVDNIRYDVSR